MTTTAPPVQEPLVPDHAPPGVEANGINTIGDAERKGHPRDQFLPWFASNVGVFGISYGAYAIGFGLSLWQGIVAGVLGIIASFVLVGIVAVAGPRASAPTQIISRAAFGVRGNRVAAVLAWVLNVGWETALTVIGTLAFATVCGKLGLGHGTGPKVVGIVVLTGLTLLGGVAGFDVIMRMQGLITVVAGVLTVVVIALSASHVHLHTVSALPGGTTASFVGMVVLGATGFGLGWVYVGADYSRYLPREASRRGVLGWTTFGGAVGPVILFAYGVLLAGSSKSLSDGIAADPVGALTTVLPHWFLVPFVVLTVLGLVGATILNVYSSGLNLQSMGLPLPRYLAALVDGTLMTAGGVYVVFFTHNFLAQFEGFLITLGVPIAAWLGIIVADIVLRRRDYAHADLYDPRGRYGDVRVLPLVLIALGTAIGWGMVTGSEGVNWLHWQGYLLSPLGLGGKSGAWAGADLGVPVAMAIGILGTLVTRGRIRRQEAAPEAPADAAAHAPVDAVAAVD